MTIVEQFKKAAINAKEAGFDGVESRLVIVSDLKVLNSSIAI